MTAGFHDGRALLAHELANLDNKRVVRQVAENFENNPNSILYVLGKITDEKGGKEHSRLVSPYLFLARYTDQDGEILLDEAAEIRAWLDEHPGSVVEIVTNSVMTSDNFSAQSVIDMSTAPRLLLDDDLREAWLNLDPAQERTSELTNSVSWREQINNPRLRVYEIGRLDADYFVDGGVGYGKLHAKYWQEEDYGFVGTSNFDYRSRLFNNEMGFFFQNEGLADELQRDFERLKAASYRWGSPEWLELRAQVMERGGVKGTTTRQQRTIYKFLKATGLHWLF